MSSFWGCRFFSSSQIPSLVFSENSPCLPKLSKNFVLKSLDLRYDHTEKQEKMSMWSIVKVLNFKRADRTMLCVCVLVTQSCPTFYDPTDCSPPGYSVHGILQARILEWVASSFSKQNNPSHLHFCISSNFRLHTIWQIS